MYWTLFLTFVKIGMFTIGGGYAMLPLIQRDVVDRDEFDVGVSKLLNLGHTVGHAVAACSGFTLLHGEGVAIGMAIITRAAVVKGLCTLETLPRLLAILERYGLPTETDYSLTDILAAAAADKKRTDAVT